MSFYLKGAFISYGIMIVLIFSVYLFGLSNAESSYGNFVLVTSLIILFIVGPTFIRKHIRYKRLNRNNRLNKKFK